MAVDILSIGYTDEYTGINATPSSVFLGEVGDVMTATVNVGVHWESLAVILTVTNIPYASVLTRNDNVSWLNCGFRVGDTITIVNDQTNTINGNYTVTALTDSQMTISTSLTAGVYTCDVHGTTAINAIDFYFNLIPNGQQINYLSLVDSGTVQKKTASVPSGTVNLVKATQSIGWDSGTGTVTKGSVSNYVQNFTIVHTFTIDPIYLSGQNLLGSAPSYFSNGSCLQYICQVDARLNAVDPNIVHSTKENYTFPLGNTGWFNEFLNGGTPEYTCLGITYTGATSGLPLDAVSLNEDTLVSILIYSASGHLTIGGGSPTSQLAVNIMYCPLDESDYVGTSTTFQQNFRIDRVLATLGASSVNGNNYGTAYQSLKNVQCTRTNNNNATVTFTVSYSSQIKSFLQGKSEGNRQFAIWVTPQKGTALDLIQTDRNAVLCDFDNCVWDQDDPTCFEWVGDIDMFQYPNTTTNGKTDYKGFIQDLIATSAQMLVAQSAKLISIGVDVVCAPLAQYYTQGTPFSLRSVVFNFANQYLPNGSLCQSEYYQQPNQLKVAPGDPRGETSFFRNQALDQVYPAMVGYQLDDGFLARYEDWVNNPSFDSAFVCSHSQKWSVYSMMPGWGLFYQITAQVQNAAGYTTTFIRTVNVTLNDTTSNPDGFGGQLQYTIDTSVTTSGGPVSLHGIISLDQVTHVTLTVTGNLASIPSGYTGVWGFLAVDKQGTGGQAFLDKSSSEEPLLPGTIWATQAVVTKVSNSEYTIEADINNEALDPTVSQYLLSGRFGYK